MSKCDESGYEISQSTSIAVLSPGWNECRSQDIEKGSVLGPLECLAHIIAFLGYVHSFAPKPHNTPWDTPIAILLSCSTIVAHCWLSINLEQSELLAYTERQTSVHMDGSCAP
ncbi:Hypothetical protein NTJ_15979 [Nesidiocoris tenuis]|uniref:Uncharacterized protein n=1 Tax=Nesidiocoris tenuis TaxID=355587 RepID=A0ABN7BFL1_9HEMI|nr:Hypothetical protein NTJ_15979 [Nesidiocoris tenuis]